MKYGLYILIFLLLPAMADAETRAKKPRRKRVKPAVEASQSAPDSAIEAPAAESAAPAANSEAAPAAQSHTGTSASGAGKVRRPYWSAGVAFTIWQEAVELKRGSSNAFMESAFKGLSFIGAYNRTIQNSYWQQYYGLEFAYGTLKGQGDQPTITDKLENQSWMMGTFKPGLIYRTSPVSRIGLMLPLVYRKISWNFKSGSGLTAADKAFSVGLGLHYVQRISKDSSIDLSLTHQRMWATSLWSAAWNYEF